MASQSSREDVGFSNEAEYLELATRAGVESVEEPLEATQASVTGNARTGNWKDGFHYLTQESSLKTALRLPQLIGIAISGTIGIGLFIMAGEVISLAGSLGTLISYGWASTIVGSFMLCLNEMLSFRYEVGAIFEYPTKFVGPAFGFAVAYIYFVSSVTGVVSLIATAAMLVGSDDSATRGGVICAIIGGLLVLNVIGDVKLYGFLEWIFQLGKVLTIMALIALMAYVNINNQIFGNFWSQYYSVPPGFNSDGTILDTTSDTIISSMEIPNGFGRFMGIMTGTNIAIYSFIGVEILAVAAGEANRTHARRDLSRSTKWMYIFTIFFYLSSVAAVGVNVGWDDPRLQAWSATPGSITSENSPFIIAMMDNPTLSQLGFPQAFKILFIISAITTANTNIYVASRTLFALSCGSKISIVRRTLGRTDSRNTPSVAIVAALIPSLLALLAMHRGNGQVVLSVFSSISVVSILCVYAAECITYINFYFGVKQHRRLRSWKANGFSRTSKQPYIAYYGLSMCCLFILFNGWHAFYEWNHSDPVSGIVIGLVSAYFAPLLFAVLFFGYRRTHRIPGGGKADFMTMSTPQEQGHQVQDEPFWKLVWLW